MAPGAANVVPALAELVVEYRDLTEISLDRMTAAIRALVAAADGKNGVAARAEPMEGLRPTAMDPTRRPLRAGGAGLRRPRSPHVERGWARWHDSGFACSGGDDVRSQHRGPKP